MNAQDVYVVEYGLHPAYHRHTVDLSPSSASSCVMDASPHSRAYQHVKGAFTTHGSRSRAAAPLSGGVASRRSPHRRPPSHSASPSPRTLQVRHTKKQRESAGPSRQEDVPSPCVLHGITQAESTLRSFPSFSPTMYLQASSDLAFRPVTVWSPPLRPSSARSPTRVSGMEGTRPTTALSASPGIVAEATAGHGHTSLYSEGYMASSSLAAGVIPSAGTGQEVPLGAGREGHGDMPAAIPEELRLIQHLRPPFFPHSSLEERNAVETQGHLVRAEGASPVCFSHITPPCSNPAGPLLSFSWGTEAAAAPSSSSSSWSPRQGPSETMASARSHSPVTMGDTGCRFSALPPPPIDYHIPPAAVDRLCESPPCPTAQRSLAVRDTPAGPTVDLFPSLCLRRTSDTEEDGQRRPPASRRHASSSSASSFVSPSRPSPHGNRVAPQVHSSSFPSGFAAPPPPFVLLQHHRQVLHSEQLQETMAAQETEAIRRVLGERRHVESGPIGPSGTSPRSTLLAGEEGTVPTRMGGEDGAERGGGATRVSCLKEAVVSTDATQPLTSLSDVAKLLFSSILYLRAIGGLPTLLRVGPLAQSSPVVEKENCLELVFFNAIPHHGHGTRSSGAAGGARAREQERMDVGRTGEEGIRVPFSSDVHDAGGGRFSEDLKRMEGSDLATRYAEEESGAYSPLWGSPAASTTNTGGGPSPFLASPSMFAEKSRRGTAVGESRGTAVSFGSRAWSTPTPTSTPPSQGASPTTTTTMQTERNHATTTTRNTLKIRRGKPKDTSRASISSSAFPFFGAEKVASLAPCVSRIHCRGLRMSSVMTGRRDSDNALMGFASSEESRSGGANDSMGSDGERQSAVEPWDASGWDSSRGFPPPPLLLDGKEKREEERVVEAAGSSSFSSRRNSKNSVEDRRRGRDANGKWRASMRPGFNTSYITARDEICVVVRAVVATKATVYRFGVSEVVHVLPPLPPSNASNTLQGKGEKSKDSAVFRMLCARQERARQRSGVSSASSLRGRGGGMKHAAGMEMGEDGRPLPPDYGDLLIAFLQTPGDAAWVSCLPPLGELESLRFRIFALQGLRVREGGEEAKEALHAATLPEWERGRGRDEIRDGRRVHSHSFDTVRMVDAQGGEMTVSREALVKEFPLYQAISIGERSLLGMQPTDAYGHRGGEFYPGESGMGFASDAEVQQEFRKFQNMNLKKFYLEFLRSIQYALTVQVQKTKEKVEYALNEF